MKTKTIPFLLPLICLVGFLLCSSFLRDANSSNATEISSPATSPDEIKYHSTSKKEYKKNNITLATGFQNDYYTNDQTEGYFYVEIAADKYLNARAQRPSMNLSIVIDRSGSMSGEKMENAKKAAKHIVDQLASNDYLSIVIYDQDVQVIHTQALVRDKQAIKNKIDGIRPAGSTNLMGGAMKGYDEVSKQYRSGYINRVLLLSDGLANEGITDPIKIKNIVQDKFRNENVAISTFGIGNDYNEDLMTSMAETGAGNYYFISRPGDIVGIFNKELNGLMEVLAQNAQLSIEVPSQVRIEEVYGYSFTQRNGQVQVKLNDIFSEERKGILIRYGVTGRSLPSSIMFETTLNYHLPQKGSEEELILVNKQRYTNNLSVYNEFFSEWVDGQVVLQNANYKMEEAMKEIDKGNYDEGKRKVIEARKIIENKPALMESNIELQKAQSANVSYTEDLRDIEIKTETEKKYIQKSSKSVNYEIRRKK